MIILFTVIPFDYHYPGRWLGMYPGVNSRDYIQFLQLTDGNIPKKNHATWILWQGASRMRYLNIDTPQQSMFETDTIEGSTPLITGDLLTDDGVHITFVETGSSWVGETNFDANPSGAFASIITYTPGAAVLPPNSSLVGSGALPQYACITDAAGTDLGAIVFCPNSYTMGTYGMGGFLNPDYQNVGDYSNVAGFTSNVGVWNSG